MTHRFRRPFRRLLPVISLAFLAAACARRGPARPVPEATVLPSGRVTVPCDLSRRSIPFVAARINGRGPYRLAVDTGTAVLALRREVAAELGLPRVGSAHFVGPTPAEGQVSRVRVPTVRVGLLEVGEARFERLDAIAVAVPDEFLPEVGPVDGFIGAAVFGDCTLTIDYAGSRIMLEAARLPPPDGKEVLPLRRDKLLGLRVPVWTDAGPVEALIDTGDAGWLVLPAATADRLPFAFGPVEVGGSHLTLFGEMPGPRAGRLRGDLRLGHHTAYSPIVQVGGDWTLGAEFLRAFELAIDQRSMAVRFARRQPMTATWPPWRTLPVDVRLEPGAWVVLKTDDTVKVTGLREGDRIIAVNGRPVSEFEEVEDAMPRKDSEVTCTVLRGPERFDVRVPVETLVP